jgi:hypothetical protein
MSALVVIHLAVTTSPWRVLEVVPKHARRCEQITVAAPAALRRSEIARMTVFISSGTQVGAGIIAASVGFGVLAILFVGLAIAERVGQRR